MIEYLLISHYPAQSPAIRQHPFGGQEAIQTVPRRNARLITFILPHQGPRYKTENAECINFNKPGRLRRQAFPPRLRRRPEGLCAQTAPSFPVRAFLPARASRCKRQRRCAAAGELLYNCCVSRRMSWHKLCRSAGGIYIPTHPPTEVTPGLRPRPLTGALGRGLLPLFAGCLQPQSVSLKAAPRRRVGEQ